jgi:hypothetical protein
MVMVVLKAYYSERTSLPFGITVRTDPNEYENLPYEYKDLRWYLDSYLEKRNMTVKAMYIYL